MRGGCDQPGVTESEHFDVIVVGAGIAGIAAAWHLDHRCPGLDYAILEGREGLGGTWDLFRYPGIRSDSDMHSLGFSFAPWRGERALADGATILDYLRETAEAHGIAPRIRFRHKVLAADWSGATRRWTLTVEAGGEARTLTCGFLYLGTGYYDFARGHLPDFAGAGDFRGRIVHPQFWGDADAGGKRVVVIGSGATAMSIVPALARTAAHVTMVQRSPSYVLSQPANDPLAARLRRWLPERIALRLTRWRSIWVQQLFYQVAQRWPEAVGQYLKKAVREAVGPGVDADRHFAPRYGPWDQRLCIVPDHDLFDLLREGTVAIETDRIERFTPEGVALASGHVVPADLIVTATGLEVRLFGGIALSVDGAPVDAAERFVYRGAMLSGVPNLVLAIGYTNASWTLRAEMVARFACRVLRRMQARRARSVVPRADGMGEGPPLLNLSSGYIARAVDRLPRQGARDPWRMHQNYLRDGFLLRFGAIGRDLDFRA